MKKIIKYSGVLFLITLLFVSGCGYTTHSLLAPEFKSIYVDNFVNGINVTAEQSNLRMYRGYKPGLEVDVTNAVKNRFVFDGNLKLHPEESANLILKGTLADFKRDALQYDANDNVEEYRIKLIVNIQLYNAGTGKIIWKENGFAGETTYRTTGPLAKSENAAMQDALNDLSRRVVERTVEAW